MTTTDLAVRATPASLQLDAEQIKFIASSNFVPKSYRGNIPEIMACIATGRELGLGDLESLRLIYVVDGKPTLSAELMVKLVRRRGHSITGEVGPETAIVHGRRGDNDDAMSVTWTMEMAKRAGLTGKTNWQKHPESMLWARAVSQLCRMLFADCLAGLSHTPEEIGVDEPPFVELTEPPDIDSERGAEGPNLSPASARVETPATGRAARSDTSEQQSVFEQMADEVQATPKRGKK